MCITATVVAVIGIVVAVGTAVASGVAASDAADREEKRIDDETARATKAAKKAKAANYKSAVKSMQIAMRGYASGLRDLKMTELELSDKDRLKKKHTPYRKHGGTNSSQTVSAYHRKTSQQQVLDKFQGETKRRPRGQTV